MPGGSSPGPSPGGVWGPAQPCPRPSLSWERSRCSPGLEASPHSARAAPGQCQHPRGLLLAGQGTAVFSYFQASAESGGGSPCPSEGTFPRPVPAGARSLPRAAADSRHCWRAVNPELAVLCVQCGLGGSCLTLRDSKFVFYADLTSFLNLCVRAAA